MLPFWIVLLLVAASIAVLGCQLIPIVYAWALPRVDPDSLGSSPEPTPAVSVIVAARNEEAELPATLDALLAQDYPNLEILVSEEGSTDGTQRVIDARAPRVRHVAPPSVPEGWVGKNWACWNGALAATGEWLLFLDADVRIDPACVRSAMRWAQTERADLASLGFQVETQSFWERVVLPLNLELALTYLRVPFTNRDRSTAAVANGQFWLTPRSVYFEVGGHRSVASRVLEDVAIARRYRSQGRRLRIGWAPRLAVTRMYADRSEMFEGLLKNVRGMDYSIAYQVVLWLGLWAMFLLPLGVLPFAVAEGSAGLVIVGALLYVFLFGKHVVLSKLVGAGAEYGLLFPLAAAFYVALVTVSIGQGLRGKPVRWKGRSYPVRRP